MVSEKKVLYNDRSGASVDVSRPARTAKIAARVLLIESIALAGLASIVSCGGEDFTSQNVQDASVGGSSGTSGTGGVAGKPDAGGFGGSSGSAGISGNGGVSGSSGKAGEAGVGGVAGNSGSGGIAGTGGEAGSAGSGGMGGSSGTAGMSGDGGAGGVSGSGGIAGAGGIGGTAGTSGSGGAGGTGPVACPGVKTDSIFFGSILLNGGPIAVEDSGYNAEMTEANDFYSVLRFTCADNGGIVFEGYLVNEYTWRSEFISADNLWLETRNNSCNLVQGSFTIEVNLTQQHP